MENDCWINILQYLIDIETSQEDTCPSDEWCLAHTMRLYIKFPHFNKMLSSGSMLNRLDQCVKFRYPTKSF